MQYHGRGNWLIAISPYFFPTLSVVVMLIMLSLDGDALRTAKLVLGVTVAYHATSTYRETHRQQPDLQEVGFRFAWCFLPMANVASFGMILAMARVGPGGMTDFLSALWAADVEFWKDFRGMIG